MDVSKRIGAGKGIIEDPVDFDKWDDEIADLFEGVIKWIKMLFIIASPIYGKSQLNILFINQT